MRATTTIENLRIPSAYSYTAIALQKKEKREKKKKKEKKNTNSHTRITDTHKTESYMMPQYSGEDNTGCSETDTDTGTALGVVHYQLCFLRSEHSCQEHDHGALIAALQQQYRRV